MTSSATAEIDNGPHSASTLSWISTVYVTLITIHFIRANLGLNSYPTPFVQTLQHFNHETSCLNFSKIFEDRQTDRQSLLYSRLPLSKTFLTDRPTERQTRLGIEAPSRSLKSVCFRFPWSKLSTLQCVHSMSINVSNPELTGILSISLFIFSSDCYPLYIGF